MAKIIIAACRQYPDLSASNAAYAAALTSQGAEVEILAWNDGPPERFENADVTVLRQTWDYQADPGGFAAWASALQAREVERALAGSVAG